VIKYNEMLNFLNKKNNSADEKEIIELKKKIAYMETDISILKSQYDRLLTRTKVEEMSEARAAKKRDEIDIQNHFGNCRKPEAKSSRCVCKKSRHYKKDTIKIIII